MKFQFTMLGKNPIGSVLITIGIVAIVQIYVPLLTGTIVHSTVSTVTRQASASWSIVR